MEIWQLTVSTYRKRTGLRYDCALSLLYQVQKYIPTKALIPTKA